MARLAGHWGAPTITGARSIAVGGVAFCVPDSAMIKLVKGTRFEVAHVKHAGRVIVLSARGQLLESDAEAKARATKPKWSTIAGDRI